MIKKSHLKNGTIFLAILLIMTVPFFASCAEEEATPTPTETPISTPSQIPTGPTGKLTVAIATAQLEDVLPHMITGASLSYCGHMYDSLVGASPDGSLSKETGIASDWESPDGGKTWNFTIKSGITFHNGEALTAEDVKFSIELHQLPEAKSSNAPIFREKIADIIVQSPTKLTVVLSEVDVQFPIMLCCLAGAEGVVVPKDYYNAVGTDGFRDAPIGSGPFKFVSRQIGVGINFTANEEYWRGAPGFKDLEILLVAEDSTRIAMLRTGEADIINLTKPLIAEVESAGLEVKSVPYTVNIGIQFYRSQDAEMIYHSKAVREALALAIDKEAILDTLFDGRGDVASSYLFTPVMEGYDPSLDPYPYDPERAIQILEDAGISKVELKFWSFTIPGAPDLPKLALAVAGYWNNIGVDVEVIPVDFASFRPKYRANPQDVDPPGEVSLYTALTMPSSFPNVRWYALSHEAGGLMEQGGSFSQQIDELYTQASTEIDAVERNELLMQLDRIMYDEYLSIPLVVCGTEYGVGPEVASWSPTPGSLYYLVLESAIPNE